MKLPDSTEVMQKLSYDPVSGHFSRLTGSKRGTTAGGLSSTGYIHISIGRGKVYLAHRLAWFCVHGIWPDCQIDHINGNRADNRLLNLRLASRGQNVAAGPIRKTNKSGFKGVYWHSAAKKWHAQIVHEGKHHYLGLHETAEAAHEVYVSASRRLHGEFAPANTVKDLLEEPEPNQLSQARAG